MHFPRIWNAPWFDWVQYNGSIQQPMVRNAGEALGVGAYLSVLCRTRIGDFLLSNAQTLEEIIP